MTFFSHRPGFYDFPYLYCVKCRNMTLSSQEKPLFHKRIPWWHLFYSVRTLGRIRQHYF